MLVIDLADIPVDELPVLSANERLGAAIRERLKKNKEA